MSYDRDPERYAVECDGEGYNVVDTYYDETERTFTDEREAFVYCQACNDNYSEEMGMRAMEAAFEHYWEGN